MSNERIDLNQFEAITKGPWRAFEDIEGDGHKTGAWSVGNQLYDLNLPPLHGGSDFSGTYSVMGICVLSSSNCEANAKAIAALPELIAELKRCYERIDELESSEEE